MLIEGARGGGLWGGSSFLFCANVKCNAPIANVATESRELSQRASYIRKQHVEAKASGIRDKNKNVKSNQCMYGEGGQEGDGGSKKTAQRNRAVKKIGKCEEKMGGTWVIAGSNAALRLYRVAPNATPNPGRQVSRCPRRIPTPPARPRRDQYLQCARGAFPAQRRPLSFPSRAYSVGSLLRAELKKRGPWLRDKR